MKISQVFLPNTPDYYQASTGLTALKQQIVEIPLEQIETVATPAGHIFAPGGVTSWSWLESEGKEVCGYLNAARLHGEDTPTHLPHERDPQWFRREHAAKVKEEGWYVEPDTSGKLYTDPRIWAYRKYLVEKILATGVKTIVFDNATLDSNRVAWAVEGWFRVYDDLRGSGVKVIGNGLWQKDFAMEHCDGFQCELWVDHRPHYLKPDGQWGALTEAEFAVIARRWVASGKVVNMLVRWKPEGSVFTTYDKFCEHYMDIAESCDATPSFARVNYQESGWREWMSKHQGDTVIPPPPVDKDLEARVLALEGRTTRLEKLYFNLDKNVTDLETWQASMREACA